MAAAVSSPLVTCPSVPQRKLRCCPPIALVLVQTSDDDQDVIRVRGLDLSDGFVDDRREVGRPCQAQRRRDLAIASQHFVKAVASTAVGLKGEDGSAASRGISKAKGRDQIVVVKGLERAADNGDDALIAQYDSVEWSVFA